MKNLILIHLAICFCSFTNATDNTASKTLWNKTAQTVTVDAITSNLKGLHLTELDRLIEKSTKKDNLGFTHYTYQQLHKNVPVENATIIVHEKNGKVELLNGQTAHRFSNKTTASIDETKALQLALNFVNAELYAWKMPAYEETLRKAKGNDSATFHPIGELIWYKSSDEEESYQLNYKFDIYSIKPNARQYVYVNATTGEITESISKMTSCTTSTATAETNYYGTVELSTCYEDGHFHLKNLDNKHIEVYDARETHFTIASEITDADNYFEKDKAANEVFWASQKIYNYFKNKFERNSIDNRGMPILSWVNYANKFGYKNSAFWNGDWMLFGSGDGENYNALTSTDIVAHELMHGINDFTAKLIYKNESGALEESFSDIFGEVIEAHIKGSNDWLIGAEIVALENKTALRNLSNPKDEKVIYQQPNTYKGNNWWTKNDDNGGVHYNSGVQNYWFYLLANGGSGINDHNYTYNVEAIGIEKAAKIAYRNLTYYLTPTATFFDAQNGAIRAAIDLFGEDSFEVQQTELAWRAVGLGKQNEEPELVFREIYESDSLALIALYNNTNGNYSWTNKWDFKKPMNEWHGVSINDNRNVTKLELPDNGLIGTVTNELKTMNGLEVLNLSYNQLSGKFPKVKSIKEINLSNNNLEGRLPNLSHFRYSKIVNLANNKFSGGLFISGYDYSNIETLNLAGNQLEGDLSFTVAKLPNLKNLYLNNNLFTGKLLSDFAIIPNIETLHVQNNLLSGCISSKFEKFCDNNEVDFDMSGNNLPFNMYEFCNAEDTGCWGPSVPCRISDAQNLMILADYIDGWDKTKPINDWPGITLNADGCVIIIYIEEDIVGTLPPEIGNFEYLEIFDGAESNLSGPIPPEIGLLTKLKVLDLDDASFSGEVPLEISNLQQLEYLDLADNLLSGSITFLENMLSLRSCRLDDNYFSGHFPSKIAEEINLSIYDNRLSGCYPEVVLNLCDKHTDSDISRNNNFDISWSEFCKEGVQACATAPSCRTKDSLTLVKIHQALINNNDDYAFWNFEKPIDTWNGVTLNEFGCVSELKFFEDPTFYGSLPAEIGDLQNLETLIMYDCFLPGEIPADLGNLPLLTTLNLQWNELSGEIPPALGDLELLTTLNLSGNQLSGEITDELFGLYSIASLDLSSNNLTGEIPQRIGYRRMLKSLNLSGNNLTGSLPYIFGRLESLEFLDVSYNQLSAECLKPELKQICDAEITLTGSNANLEQNSFGVTWDDFCNKDQAICTPCRYTDSLALVKIHESLKGENGEDFWDFNTTINDWTGISLNDEGCVSRLGLGAYGNYISLSGSIPAEIGDLKSLKYLDLARYNLSGNLPQELGSLSELETLRLDSNNFEGELPASIANLNKLTFVYMQNNNLSGCFASELKKLCSLNFLYGSTNIDEGNNFDATWDEFCSSDIGNCDYNKTCRQTDSLTLVKLSKNLKNHYNEDIWPSNKPLDNWAGVTLNEAGCVKEIQFIEADIQGFLSPEIGDLTSLEKLLIIDGDLSGEIPKEIGNLTKLEMLGLSSNNFKGQIPNEITQLTNLKSIDLSSNNLTGEIPAQIGKLVNLTYINLVNNNLSGNLPSSLANLTKLHALSVSNNNMTGCFPPKLANLCDQFTQPQAIDTGNNFEASWEDFCNAGEGTCPEIITCRQTDSLTLVKIHNHLKGNGNDFWDLNTPIDTWNGITLNEDGCVAEILLQKIDSLNFNTNLPAEIGDLQSLIFLAIRGNLIGEIPKELGNLAELDILDLSHNNFEGNIPAELGQLKKLSVLFLYNNNLQGNIPSFIGNFEKLGWLELNNNQFTGSMPVSFANLPLFALRINNNNLSGCYEPALKKLCEQLNVDGWISSIEEGNNFDATWEDFCSNNAGVCIVDSALSCRQTDSLTLLKIHEHLKGNGNDFWDLNTPIDTWNGITLNEDGCVSWFQFGPQDRLSFNTNLPPIIGNLKSLELLHLPSCNLTGEIPIEIANLAELEILSLGNNKLEGIIPQELSQLKKLNVLTLGKNQLEGNIPSYIGEFDNLSWLELNDNQLTGSIPATFGNSNISILNIGNNNLSGCYPPMLSTLCSQLDADPLHRNIDTGNNFDATWDDFCNTNAGACIDTLINDCNADLNDCNKLMVWPGDMDNNGFVNSNDLLFYGLAYGKTGTARENSTTQWEAQSTDKWNNIVSNINGVHQDANGNGIVEKEDVDVITNNFGKANNTNERYSKPNNTNVRYGSTSIVNFNLALNSSAIIDGNIELVYDLYVKNNFGLAPNLHGLAGIINFSGLPVDEISVDFSQSSIEPTEYFSFFDTRTGILDFSLTRTDRENVEAKDAVARIVVIVVDDVPTGEPYKIEMNSGSFTTIAGELNEIGNSNFYNSYNTNSGISNQLQVFVNTVNQNCNTNGNAEVIANNGMAPYTIQWSNGVTGKTNYGLEAGVYDVYITDALGSSQQISFTIFGTSPVYDQNYNLICGTVCPDYLQPSALSNTNTYQSAKVIESSSVFIGGKNVEFIAGDTISLEKGFYVAPDVDFSAEIEDCE